MTEDQFRLLFKKNIKNLTKLCDERNKYHELYRKATSVPQKEKAKYTYDKSVHKLKEGHKGMNATIDGLDKAWKRRTGERPIDRFWEDFEKEVSSNWDDKASSQFCKIFSKHLQSHPEWS